MKQWMTICLLGICGSLLAQGTGSVEIIKDARLDKLMEMYKDIDTKNPVTTGYRIQIYSEASRAEVQKVKDKFYAQFPGKRPFIVYNAPNFKLRIGNYRSRMEAYKDLTEILTAYSTAFIVKDEINLSDL